MKRRIAVVGIDLESNALAPVMTEADFREGLWLEGEGLLRVLGGDNGFGFTRHLPRALNAEIVPIFLLYPEAGGPCDHAFFERLMAWMERLFREAGPLDGVFIYAHGAGTTTQLDDLDGAYFARVRALVGPEVPIVALLDLHANVSREMVDAVDVLVAFRTNPHVDVPERVAECAQILAKLIEGARPSVAYRRLPIVIPQIMQLTAPSEPYGKLVALAEDLTVPPVLNISVLSGFPLSDAHCCGMSIVVTTLGDPADAEAIADRLAHQAWAMRAQFRLKPLTSIAEATDLARALMADPAKPPLLFADLADNPGGGGRGNTTWVLEAFLEAGVTGAQFGLFYDPELVADAAQAGVGATFAADFNRSETSAFSRPFAAAARVVRLTEGPFRNGLGVGAGKTYDLGPCALLEIRDNFIAVCSRRQQLLGPDFLAHFGLEPAAARAIVVKSRGHFRAGFASLFRDAQIVEVAAPGIVTQDLHQVNWTRLERPIYPLEPETPFPQGRPHRKSGRVSA